MSFPKVHVASDSQCVVSVTFSDTLWMHVVDEHFLGTSTVF